MNVYCMVVVGPESMKTLPHLDSKSGADSDCLTDGWTMELDTTRHDRADDDIANSVIPAQTLMEPLILLQFEPRPLKTKYRKKTLWRRPPLDYQAFFGSCQEKRATAFSSAQLASQLTPRLSNSNSLSPVMLHIFLASYPDSARMQSHHFPLTASPL